MKTIDYYIVTCQINYILLIATKPLQVLVGDMELLANSGKNRTKSIATPFHSSDTIVSNLSVKFTL